MVRPLFRPEALERLIRPDQYDTPLLLPSSHDKWLWASALLLLAGVFLWGLLTRVPVYLETYGRILSDEAVLYVRDSQGLTRGMTIHILPRQQLAYEYGYLVGTIRTVLKTQVYATLERDDLHYRWTLPHDPLLTANTPITGYILVGEQNLWQSLYAAR